MDKLTVLHGSPENYDDEEDLIEMCGTRCGWAVKEQLENLFNGKPMEEQNDNALYMLYNFLINKKEPDLADQIKRFLKKEGYKPDYGHW